MGRVKDIFSKSGRKAPQDVARFASLDGPVLKPLNEINTVPEASSPPTRGMSMLSSRGLPPLLDHSQWSFSAEQPRGPLDYYEHSTDSGFANNGEVAQPPAEYISEVNGIPSPPVVGNHSTQSNMHGRHPQQVSSSQQRFDSTPHRKGRFHQRPVTTPDLSETNDTLPLVDEPEFHHIFEDSTSYLRIGELHGESIDHTQGQRGLEQGQSPPNPGYAEHCSSGQINPTHPAILTPGQSLDPGDSLNVIDKRPQHPQGPVTQSEEYHVSNRTAITARSGQALTPQSMSFFHGTHNSRQTPSSRTYILNNELNANHGAHVNPTIAPQAYLPMTLAQQPTSTSQTTADSVSTRPPRSESRTGNLPAPIEEFQNGPSEELLMDDGSAPNCVASDEESEEMEIVQRTNSNEQNPTSPRWRDSLKQSSSKMWPSKGKKQSTSTNSTEHGVTSQRDADKRIRHYLKGKKVSKRKPGLDWLSTLIVWVDEELAENAEKERDNFQNERKKLHKRSGGCEDAEKDLKDKISHISNLEANLKAADSKINELSNRNHNIAYNLRQEISEHQKVRRNYDDLKYESGNLQRSLNNANANLAQNRDVMGQLESERARLYNQQMELEKKYRQDLAKVEGAARDAKDQLNRKIDSLLRQHKDEMAAAKLQAEERENAKAVEFTQLLEQKDNAHRVERDAMSSTIASQNKRIAAYNTGDYKVISDQTFSITFQTLSQQINKLVHCVPRPESYSAEEPLDPTNFLARNNHQGTRHWPKFVRSICWQIVTRGFFHFPLGFGALGSQGEGYDILFTIYQAQARPSPEGKLIFGGSECFYIDKLP